MGFLFHPEGTDGLGRTDLSADIAVLFTRGQTELHLGGPQACQSRFPQTGLKRIGQAGFHTFATPDAGAKKLGLEDGSRRPNELMLALKRSERSLRRDKAKRQSSGSGIEKPPARQVDG